MPNILIVDDEAMLLELAQAQLDRLQVGITTTTQGLEALKLISQQHFDVVVTDYKLEGQTLTGIEIAMEAMRKNIAVVLYTGSTVPLPDELQNVLVLRKPSLKLRQTVTNVLSTRNDSQ